MQRDAPIGGPRTRFPAAGSERSATSADDTSALKPESEPARVSPNAACLCKQLGVTFTSGSSVGVLVSPRRHGRKKAGPPARGGTRGAADCHFQIRPPQWAARMLSRDLCERPCRLGQALVTGRKSGQS